MVLERVGCPADCMSCKSVMSVKLCTACKSGSYLIGGKCNACDASCKTCKLLPSMCTACDDDSYLSNGTCTACSATIPDCAACTTTDSDVLTCTQCNLFSGTILDGTTGKCKCVNLAADGTQCCGAFDTLVDGVCEKKTASAERMGSITVNKRNPSGGNTLQNAPVAY
eukprot:GDKI01014363.1.p1 GENE.GDKI01014363.1~~GDKI01014363.1.p1  ORF type:complete len:168 (-),score=33.69 GDKI01014363.1:723-1226(-)